MAEVQMVATGVPQDFDLLVNICTKKKVKRKLDRLGN